MRKLLRGSTPSQGEQQREQGEQKYAAVLEWAARGAGQIDAYWEKYSRNCVVSANAGGDRVWFAVYEPNGVRLNMQLSNCDDWLEEVRTNANQIRDEVVKAGEEARRNGVYPGVMRDLRRRQKLDWSGFER